MLVAVADVALIVANTGLLIVVLMLAALIVLAGGVLAARNMGRHEALDTGTTHDQRRRA
ncbi:hypothetical protein [Actinoplanes sp. NPDC051851]|uniref:hypothetical protein n=1 Tax=Actinoplanes sp. NPDC051851 TaxID=3154753 RepID=UPI0034260251